MHNPRFALQGASVLEVARHMALCHKAEVGLAMLRREPRAGQEAGAVEAAEVAVAAVAQHRHDRVARPEQPCCLAPTLRVLGGYEPRRVCGRYRRCTGRTRCPQHTLLGHETVEAVRHKHSISSITLIQPLVDVLWLSSF